MTYGLPNEPVTDKTSIGTIVHHPKFGIALKERMDKLGIGCIVRYRGQKNPPRETALSFLLRQLKADTRQRKTR